MPGKNEYIPSPIYERRISLKQAIQDQERLYEDFQYDGPIWYNKKIGDWERYTIEDDILFIPNRLYRDGEWLLKGIYNRYPIYFIDEDPNPYSFYKVHFKRRALMHQVILEGIK